MLRSALLALAVTLIGGCAGVRLTVAPGARPVDAIDVPLLTFVKLKVGATTAFEKTNEVIESLRAAGVVVIDLSLAPPPGRPMRVATLRGTVERRSYFIESPLGRSEGPLALQRSQLFRIDGYHVELTLTDSDGRWLARASVDTDDGATGRGASPRDSQPALSRALRSASARLAAALEPAATAPAALVRR